MFTILNHLNIINMRYKATVYLTQNVNNMVQLYYTEEFAYRWVALIYCYFKLNHLTELMSRNIITVQVEIIEL